MRPFDAEKRRALCARCGLALVASAAVLLAHPAAAWAAASARLVYVRGPGAEDCPAEAAVRAAVETRLGYDPFFPWAKESLFAEITRDKRAYRAEIKLVDEQNHLVGDRSLTVKGDDCGAVVDAMGLTISLTIDPSSAMGRSPSSSPTTSPSPSAGSSPRSIATVPTSTDAPSSTPEPPEPPVPRAPSSPPLLVASRPAERPRRARSSPPSQLRFHAGAGAFGAAGAEPSPSLGATLLVGLSWRDFSLDLEGRTDLPATASSRLSPAGVRSWLAAGALVPCVHLGAMFGCPVLTVGLLQASAVDVSSPTAAQDLWMGAGGRLGVELPLVGPWSMRAYGELLGMVHRDALFIGGAKAFEFPIASGDAGLALVVRFP